MKKQIGDYRVLLVEDHMISLRLLQVHLEVSGFRHIEIAMNGAEAAEAMEKDQFDIVFLDWSMPVKDGVTFLKECRAQRKYDGVAFIMISAEAQESRIIEALDAGATAYIVKPLIKAELEETVARVLNWLDRKAA